MSWVVRVWEGHKEHECRCSGMGCPEMVRSVSLGVVVVGRLGCDGGGCGRSVSEESRWTRGKSDKVRLGPRLIRLDGYGIAAHLKEELMFRRGGLSGGAGAEPTLGCFEVLPSAVSLGGEARLRGRGLVRGPEGPEGR